MSDCNLSETRSTAAASEVVTPDSECPIVESVRSVGMLRREILDVNVAARNAIGERSVALYGAAGAGFSDYHTTINAPTAFFLSRYERVNLPECLESVAQLLRDSSFEDLIKDRPSMQYKVSKFVAGYSTYGALEGQYRLANAMAMELLACGVRDISVSCVGDTPRIEYSLAGKDFSIFFLQQDLLTFDYAALRDKVITIDAYYHRAAMDIPSYYQGQVGELFRSLFEGMPVGGAFVTDDICAAPDIAWVHDCYEDFPLSFDGISGELQLKLLPIPVLRRLREVRSSNCTGLYGSDLKVRTKIDTDPLG